MEIWEKHPSINDLEVSTQGKLRRPSGKRVGISREERNGYMRASVKLGNDYVWRRIHQLVMETFNPQPMPGLVIDHVDDDKTNNALTNLRWVTNQENLQKAANQGKMSHGGVCKPIVSVDENGKALTWPSSAAAARALGIGDYTVARVLGGMQIEARTQGHSYKFYYLGATA